VWPSSVAGPRELRHCTRDILICARPSVLIFLEVVALEANQKEIHKLTKPNKESARYSPPGIMKLGIELALQLRNNK
jgi:hypothetical protein